MWILYLLLPFIFNPFGFDGHFSYNRSVYYQPKEIFLAIISVIVLIYTFSIFIKKRKYYFTKINILLLAFLIIFFIGLLYTKSIYDGNRVIMGFTFFWIAYLYGTILKRHRTKFLYGLIVVGVVQAIIGILQYYEIYYKILPVLMYSGRCNVMGTIGYVNWFSHFITIIFLISTFLMFANRTNRIKKLLLIGNLIMFYAILNTQTRASWLGIIIVFLYMIIFARKIIFFKNKRIALFFSLGLLIEIIFFSLTIPIDKRVQDTVEDPIRAISGRVIYWEESLEMIKEKPFLGQGTGSWRKEEGRIRQKLGLPGYGEHSTKLKINLRESTLNVKYRIIPGHAHNEYLQIFAENGIFALMLFLYILYAIIAKNFKFHKKYPVKSNLFFLPLLFIMIVNVFSFPLHTPHNGMLVFLFLGLFDSFNFHFAENNGMLFKKSCGSILFSRRIQKDKG